MLALSSVSPGAISITPDLDLVPAIGTTDAIVAGAGVTFYTDIVVDKNGVTPIQSYDVAFFLSYDDVLSGSDTFLGRVTRTATGSNGDIGAALGASPHCAGRIPSRKLPALGCR